LRVKVGLSIGGGVRALERIDPRELAGLGLRSVFVACAEDEMRWHAEEAAGFTRSCQAAELEVYAVPLGYGKVMDPDPSVDSLYVREHPRNLQLDSRGRRCGKACPNSPAFLEWFSSSMRTLAWLLECDGFLWDEPSFYFARGAGHAGVTTASACSSRNISRRCRLTWTRGWWRSDAPAS